MYYDTGAELPLDGVLADVPINENHRIGQSLDVMNYMTLSDLGGMGKSTFGHARGGMQAQGAEWWSQDLQFGGTPEPTPEIPLAQLTPADGGAAARKSHECVVCYERMTLSDSHKHFTKCGHGQLFCKNCAEKVDVCPMCREIKPGREAAVAEAVERISNDPSFVSCNHEAREERSGGESPVLNVEDTDADMETPFSRDTTEELGVPSLSVDADTYNVDMETLFSASPARELSLNAWDGALTNPLGTVPRASSEERDIHNIETMLRSFAEGSGEDAGQAMVAPSSPAAATIPRLEATRLQTTVQTATPSPAVGGPTAKPAEALETVLESHKDASLSAATQKKDSHVSQKGNPFARHKISDSEVSDCSFTEFVSLMRWLKFTPAEVEEGKKFRKRLKNRKQVMSYSARKRNASSTLEKRNEFLEREVDQLNTQNKALTQKNDLLNSEIRNHESMRLAAESEARNLRARLQTLRMALQQ